MKQKYSIKKDPHTGNLAIQEFAELDKDIFSLVCEERYEFEKVNEAVSTGKDSVIETLRTPNLYPVAEFADKIADSVAEIYSRDDKDSEELEFDDIEAIKKERASAEGEGEEEESVALDELLNDDLDESESSADDQGEEDEDSDDKSINLDDENTLDVFDSDEDDEDENE